MHTAEHAKRSLTTHKTEAHMENEEYGDMGTWHMAHVA